jgi:hypothetical protein
MRMHHAGASRLTLDQPLLNQRRPQLVGEGDDAGEVRGLNLVGVGPLGRGRGTMNADFRRGQSWLGSSLDADLPCPAARPTPIIFIPQPALERRKRIRGCRRTLFSWDS